MVLKFATLFSLQIIGFKKCIYCTACITVYLSLSTLTLVDDLIEKYGGGETFTRKCDTCDYEQEVRSEGVHVSNGGSIQVFSDEDEFSCPNCNTNRRIQEIADSGEKLPVVKNF